MLGGESVKAAFTHRVTFVLSYAGGESRSGYRRFLDALEANDRPRTLALLESLEVERLYEDAIHSLGRAYHERKWGDALGHLDALRHAVAQQRHGDYLPRETLATALETKLHLELPLGHYGTARQTIEAMDADARSTPDLQRIATALEVVRTNNERFTTHGRFAATSTSWFGASLKQRSAITMNRGAIREIKLRRGRAFVHLPYREELEYSIAPSAGARNVELVGDPGTEFSLLQS